MPLYCASFCISCHSWITRLKWRANATVLLAQSRAKVGLVSLRSQMLHQRHFNMLPRSQWERWKCGTLRQHLYSVHMKNDFCTKIEDWRIFAQELSQPMPKCLPNSLWRPPYCNSWASTSSSHCRLQAPEICWGDNDWSVLGFNRIPAHG